MSLKLLSGLVITSTSPLQLAVFNIISIVIVSNYDFYLMLMCGGWMIFIKIFPFSNKKR